MATGHFPDLGPPLPYECVPWTHGCLMCLQAPDLQALAACSYMKRFRFKPMTSDFGLLTTAPLEHVVF